MTYQPFPIYDFRTGLDLSIEPWKAPADAFTTITNGYLRRGRLKKRFGQSVFGQLGKLHEETIDPNPSATDQAGTLTNFPFIPHSLEITAGAKTVRDDGNGSLTGDVDPAGTNSIDYVTGDYDFTFDSNPGAVDTDAAYHYEVNEDCRGVFLFDRFKATNELLGFQDRRVSKWDATNNYFANIDDGAGNYDHFNSTRLVSTTSLNDIFWMVTNEPTDGVWTYDGTSATDQTAAGVLDINAAGTEDIKTCLHLFPNKSRMLMLNPVEGAGAGTRFPARMRWSWVGDPLVAGAWQEDVPGRGGHNDCPTNYEILDYGYVGEIPIVFFEKGLWAIDYTGDPVLPFAWRKISLTHQTSATHSKIEYDKLVTAVGGKGMVASAGSPNDTFVYNSKIPDFTFGIDLDNIDLCYGIRDDRYEMGLISYPSLSSSNPNNKILVYNYEDDNYCEFELNSRVFGEWTTATDLTFDSFAGTTFDELPTLLWGDHSLQAGFPIILSGWEDGFVYEINNDQTGLDADNWLEQLEIGSDAPQPYNFDWRTIRFNPYIQEGKQAVLGRLDLLVDKDTEAEFTVDFFSDTHDYPYETKTVTCSSASPKDKVWKSIEVNMESNFHSFRFYLSDSQMADATKNNQQIIINAMILWVKGGSEVL